MRLWRLLLALGLVKFRSYDLIPIRNDYAARGGKS